MGKDYFYELNYFLNPRGSLVKLSNLILDVNIRDFKLKLSRLIKI